MLNSFLSLQRDLEQDNGHFSVLGQRKEGISISEDSPKGEWDKMAELMMLKFGASGRRIHCPEVTSESKAAGNCRSTVVPTRTRSQLCFAQLLL